MSQDIASNSEIAGNGYTQPIFDKSRRVTSENINLLYGQTEEVHDFIIKALGNLYQNSQSSLAAVIGNPNEYVNDTDLVPASGNPIIDGISYYNRIPATISSSSDASGFLTITLSSGVINPEYLYPVDHNLLGLTLGILNASGNLFRVVDGTFQTLTSHTSGNISQVLFRTEDPGWLTDQTYILLSPSQTVSSTLRQLIQEIGHLHYPSISGYIDTIQTGDPSIYGYVNNVPPLSAEVDFVEDKNFVTRWESKVQLQNATFDSSNGLFSWIIPGNDLLESGSSPDEAFISGFALSNGITPSNILSSLASISGKPILDPTNKPIAITVEGGTDMTIAIASGVIPSGVLPNADIEVLIPIKTPYRLLRPCDLNYSGNNVNSTKIANIIGKQYGYQNASFPSTIASRLDYLHSEMSRLKRNLLNLVEPAGTLFDSMTPGVYTFEVPAGCFRMRLSIWGAGGGGAGAVCSTLWGFVPSNPTDIGQFAALINGQGGAVAVEGAGGGAGGYHETIIDVIPGNTYRITIGQGGSGGLTLINNWDQYHPAAFIGNSGLQGGASLITSIDNPAIQHGVLGGYGGIRGTVRNGPPDVITDMGGGGPGGIGSTIGNPGTTGSGQCPFMPGIHLLGASGGAGTLGIGSGGRGGELNFSTTGGRIWPDNGRPGSNGRVLLSTDGYIPEKDWIGYYTPGGWWE